MSKRREGREGERRGRGGRGRGEGEERQRRGTGEEEGDFVEVEAFRNRMVPWCTGEEFFRVG